MPGSGIGMQNIVDIVWLLLLLLGLLGLLQPRRQPRLRLGLCGRRSQRGRRNQILFGRPRCKRTFARSPHSDSRPIRGIP